MPTLIEFKKTSKVTGAIDGEKITWQTTGLVNASVTEAPRRAVPHYSFGGTYIEFATCPPPMYANASIVTILSSALGLLTILIKPDNFKAVRFHSFYVNVLSDEATQKTELIEILPQNVSISLDMSNPNTAGIAIYGAVVNRTAGSNKGVSDFDFPSKDNKIALEISGFTTDSIETVGFRANFVQDLTLTSLGPYMRLYGIQTPEISISGTTDKIETVKSYLASTQNANLVLNTQVINMAITNFSYELIAGYKGLGRYSVQGLIA